MGLQEHDDLPTFRIRGVSIPKNHPTSFIKGGIRCKMPAMWVLIPLVILTGIVGTIMAALSLGLMSLIGLSRYSHLVVRTWCRALYIVSGLRIRVTGRENIIEGPYLIVCNHSSHLDGPAVVLALPVGVYFVIKKELAELPVWGFAARKAGFIAIDRGRSQEAQAKLNQAVDSLREGKHVLIFPEGTRAWNDSIAPFKKGGFHLAVQAQIPILPIALNRTRSLLPRGRSFPHPGRVEIVIGKAIPTEGLGREDVPELLRKTRLTLIELRKLDPDFIPPEEEISPENG